MIEVHTAENGRPYAEINCPQCNTVIRYYDVEGSSYYGCEHCHTFFKYEHDGPPEIIRRFDADSAFQPTFALGHEGLLYGRKSVVVGYMEKWDPNEKIFWKEYLLFRPESDSYHVLVENSAEWYAVWQSERQDFEPLNTNVMSADYVVMESYPFGKYRFYTGYLFKIIYAAGEFDTNILADEDSMQVEEYEKGADMLVSETKDGQTIWYRGKHLPIIKLMRDMQPDPARVPGRHGLFRFTPGTFYPEWAVLWKFSLGMVALLGIILLVFGLGRQPRTLLNAQYMVANNSASWGKPEPINAGTVTLNGTSALAFDFSTSLLNQWLEISVTFTNITSGKSFEFTKLIEYYVGYEGGERWTEGSSDATAILSAVPAGTYQVNLYPATESIEPLSIRMIIEQDTTLFSNIILCSILILLYPAIQFYRKYNFEKEEEY